MVLLEKVASFPLRQEDIAWTMGVSLDTLERRVRKEYKISFAEFQEQRQSKFRMSILQKQYESAMNGNVGMLVWLGKNYLGQLDKTEQKQQTTIAGEITWRAKWGGTDEPSDKSGSES
jgi:hypothetical protein